MVLNSRAAVLLIAMLCPISISSAADISQQRFASQMLDDIIHVTLALYRDRVIAKLQHDGTGAATDYADRKGFVPLPEKFIRQVFLRTLVSHKLAREKQLGLALSADTLSVRLTDQALTQNQQARLVAALLNRMLHAIDDTYTSLVVDKLSVDGTGALYDYQSQRGFVPLPAVFLRDLFDALMRARQQAGYDTFGVFLLSRWNLNPQQNLHEDFASAAWKFLERQQQTQLKSGKSLKNMVWRPYLETAFAGDKIVLRMVDAITASSATCVTCHNRWEQQEAVKTRRRQQGIEVGREFQRYELIGIQAITIPLE